MHQICPACHSSPVFMPGANVCPGCIALTRIKPFPREALNHRFGRPIDFHLRIALRHALLFPNLLINSLEIESIIIKACEQVQQEMQAVPHEYTERVLSVRTTAGSEGDKSVVDPYREQHRQLITSYAQEADRKCVYCQKDLVIGAGELDMVLQTGLQHSRLNSRMRLQFYKSALAAGLVRLACPTCNRGKGVAETRGACILRAIVAGQWVVDAVAPPEEEGLLEARCRTMRPTYRDIFALHIATEKARTRGPEPAQMEYTAAGASMWGLSMRVSSVCSHITDRLLAYWISGARTLVFACKQCRLLARGMAVLWEMQTDADDARKRHARRQRTARRRQSITGEQVSVENTCEDDPRLER